MDWFPMRIGLNQNESDWVQSGNVVSFFLQAEDGIRDIGVTGVQTCALPIWKGVHSVLDVNFFDELRIGLASGDDIRQWSHGEVKKPETINYRTLRPEKDGLFCEKIFGPTRDWECYCGKYKRVRFKGIICERCGVEVTRAKVRRERMGHIELAAPVTHIWFFKGVPSRLGYLLDLAPKDLEKIIYFAAYLITSVDDESRHRDLPTIEAEISAEKSNLENRRDADVEGRQQKLEADLAELEAEGAKSDVRRKVREGGEREMRQMRDRAQREIDRLEEVLDTFRKLDVKQLISDEGLYRELRDRFGEYFEGGMGAAALQKLLADFDLEAEATSLRETIRTGKGQRKLRALKRLKVVAAFLQTRNSPMGMVLDCVPVIPPDLRPMVQLDGGRFATSDMNDLYRRVINRNNRLKQLVDLAAHSPRLRAARLDHLLQALEVDLHAALDHAELVAGLLDEPFGIRVQLHHDPRRLVVDAVERHDARVLGALGR